MVSVEGKYLVVRIEYIGTPEETLREHVSALLHLLRQAAAEPEGILDSHFMNFDLLTAMLPSIDQMDLSGNKISKD